MYKLIFSIENLVPPSFHINKNNNDLYISKNNVIELFKGNQKSGLNKFIENSKISMIIDNEIWIADLSTGKTFFDKNKQQGVNFIATTFRNVEYFISGEYVFAKTYFDRDFSKFYYTKINTQEKIIVEKYNSDYGLNGIFQVVNENLFISQNNEKCGLFSFDNICIWDVNYSDLFSSYESIGAGRTNILKTETDLYIELDKTYRINIKTGKLEQTYEQKYTNIENNILYGLQFLSMEKFELAILNTKTNVVEIIDLSNEFNKLNIHPDNRIVVSDNLIYFSQNMGANIAKIGVINPVTAKILWKFDFEKENGMIGTLKVNKNRIYAHTQDNKLHIFEANTTANNV